MEAWLYFFAACHVLCSVNLAQVSSLQDRSALAALYSATGGSIVMDRFYLVESVK